MPYKFNVLNYDTIKNADLIEHIDRVGISFYLISNHFQNQFRVKPLRFRKNKVEGANNSILFSFH